MKIFALVVALLLPGAVLAQPPSPAGEWQTELEAGPQKLPLVIQIGETVSLRSPAQGNMTVPGSMTEKDGKLILTFAGGSIRIEGTLDPDGKAIRGSFFQGGLAFPAALSRAGEPLIAAAPKRPQEPKPPFPYRAEEAAFDNPAEAGVRLAGTLTLPQGQGPFPAVILISGSGQQDRDEALLGHKPFLVLADALTRRGLAVLRYDDRGVGGSKGDVLRATSENFAGDVVAAMAFLKTRPEIDPRKIGLLGHSEGGYIAPMVAQKDPSVAFMVLLAGPGASGADVIKLQQRLVNASAGLSGAALEQQAKRQEAFIDAALGAKDDGAAAKAAVKAAMVAAGAADAQAEAQAANLSSPWFRFFLAYDPAAALRQTKVPVLALLGEKDLQVPAAQNAPALSAALAGNPKAVVEVVPSANHLFQTTATGAPTEYGMIEETMAPTTLKRIVDWVVQTTR